MKKFNVKITELYSYNIEILANSKKEALEKARKCYEEDFEKEGYCFVADATTLESTKYKVE